MTVTSSVLDATPNNPQAGFNRAVALWHLDEKTEARRSYDNAKRWTDESRISDEQIRRFTARAVGEAEELLGNNEQDTDGGDRRLETGTKLNTDP